MIHGAEEGSAICRLHVGYEIPELATFVQIGRLYIGAVNVLKACSPVALTYHRVLNRRLGIN